MKLGWPKVEGTLTAKPMVKMTMGSYQNAADDIRAANDSGRLLPLPAPAGTTWSWTRTARKNMLEAKEIATIWPRSIKSHG